VPNGHCRLFDLSTAASTIFHHSMAHRWVVIASIHGLVAVAAGAFGAHALKSRLEPSDLATFEVAVRYEMYHALALLAVAAQMTLRPSRYAWAAGACFFAGMTLFSGSLYVLSLAHFRAVAFVTPIGGGIMIVGWVLLGASAFTRSAAAPKPPPTAY
jgi:uncharacterized membrane protein YgdD (TMEM256/DUF423 family)